MTIRTKKISLWITDYCKKYDGDEPFFFPKDEIPLALFLENIYPHLHDELKVLWEGIDVET